MTPREALARIEQIERESRARLEASRLEHDLGIFRAVRNGEPLTIAGVRYIPDPDHREEWRP